MARGRMLSKSLSTSAKVAALYQASPKLAEFCRALFPLLVAHADDHGRLQGDELTVKLQVDPISPRKIADFVSALHLLHDVGLITWYQVDDRKVVEIVKFSDHQDLKGHDKRPGKLPACPGPEALIGRQRRAWGNLGKSGDTTEGNLTEGKGRELNLGSSAASAEPAVLDFPTVGTNGNTWGLTDSQVQAWRSAYPSLDILAEARKALAWLQANPGRRKTTQGMAKFLVSWLNRATDRGRSVPAAKSPQASQVGKRSLVPMGIQDV